MIHTRAAVVMFYVTMVALVLVLATYARPAQPSSARFYACQALLDRPVTRADTTHAITKCGDWDQPIVWRSPYAKRKDIVP